MKKYILLVLLSSCFSAKSEAVLDSIRTEAKGKGFVVFHKVEQGQTLYSLLKRYKCTPELFKTENPEVKGNTLKVGQTIKFPTSLKPVKAKTASSSPKSEKASPKSDDGIEVVDVPEASEKSNPSSSASQKKHLILQGETLYGISKKYKLAVNDLKAWNQLVGNEVKVGQYLWLQKPTGDKIEWENKNWEEPKPEPVSSGSPADEVPDKEKIEVIEIDRPAPVSEVPAKPSTVPNAPSIPKTIENGLAERIDGNDNSGKYLAMHRTAEVGTLIQVKNESNGKTVWVKVIGKIPDIGTNEGVLIKLSPKAFEKLDPTDKRIRAELSYINQ